MKKKGRVCGTIGFLLAVALVGGTVVYSSMFDKYSVVKAQKPIGVATGNIVNAITKKEGYEETKKFVTQAATLVEAKGTETYKSYSSKFSMKQEAKATEGNVTTISVTEISGVLYTDDSYTYITTETSLYNDRTATYARIDAVYEKDTGDVWIMSTPSQYPQNGADTSYFKDAKWEKNTTIAVSTLGGSAFAVIADAFSATADVRFDFLAGVFKFENAATADGVTAKDVCTFSVGYMPRVTRVLTVTSAKAYSYTNVTIDYSNLNNTVVNLPETLVAAKGV